MKNILRVGVFLLVFRIESLSTPKPSSVISIRNAHSRKLTLTISSWRYADIHDRLQKKFAFLLQQELIHLVKFSGFFRLLLTNPSRQTFSDTSIWQTNSLVDTIISGKISRVSPVDFNLELRTYDAIRKTEFMKKKYQNISSKNYQNIIASYLDFIINKYTGKKSFFKVKIAFIGKKSKNNFKQLYICDFDGRNVEQLTFEKSIHLAPAWSPDGRHILYTSFEKGDADLFIIDVKERKKRLLFRRKGMDIGGDFAPNRPIIAYSSHITKKTQIGRTNIFYRSLSPSGISKELIVGSAIDVEPSFSPDGRYLAYVSGRYGNPHIFLATLKWGGGTKSPTLSVLHEKRLTWAGWYNSSPVWSPNSRQILFSGYDKKTDRYDLFLMNFDGSNMKRLTLHNGDNQEPDWSPSGHKIIFQTNRIPGKKQKGRWHLYTMNADGSYQLPIPLKFYSAEHPVWSVK